MIYINLIMKKNISTRNLNMLPRGVKLKSVCQSIAMLDAIIEPEWEFRYYSFNSKWDANQEMASMRDGSGDSYFILFEPHGTIIKGFAHNSLMGIYSLDHGHPYPGILDEIPDVFSDFLKEPAFSLEETSFCIWCRLNSDWTIGNIDFPVDNDPDGSADLLYMLDGNPQTYQEWGKEYYDREIPNDLIEAIYRHERITSTIVAGLNPKVRIEDLESDINEIGYPR